MGDCQKTSYIYDSISCPTDFEIEILDNGKVKLTEYQVCGGPDEPIYFDTAEQARDYASAQKFAYDLLVKIAYDKY